LHRAYLAGEATAAARLAAVFPEAAAAAIPLARAQTVIAREQGFPSWPAMKAAIEVTAPAIVHRPKSASELDAAGLAETWFALSALEDLGPLNRALNVKKGRIEAARALMQAQPDRYRAFQAALVRGLSSKRKRTRFECAGALDQFGDASTRPALAALMDDPVPRVRWMAMHALTCHHCGGKPDAMEPHVRSRIIEATRSDPSPVVRRHAAGALALAHETSAAPAVRELLDRETDPKGRRLIAWALGELTRGGAPA
jgi:HEAT repeat protein